MLIVGFVLAVVVVVGAVLVAAFNAVGGPLSARRAAGRFASADLAAAPLRVSAGERSIDLIYNLAPNATTGDAGDTRARCAH